MTTTSSTIPTTAAAVTARWLSGALRAGGTIGRDVTVTAVATEPVGVGIGLVGALARITPTYEGGAGPATVIAKFPAPDEASRFVANVLSMYRKEVGFYQELSNRTAMPHAAGYYCDHDAETDEFVVLMEDLGAVEAGSRVVDQLAGCDRADAEAAIDALADFHAGFWNDDTLLDTDWLGALCDSPFPESIAMSFDQAWGPVQEMFPEHLTPEIKDFGDRYSELLPSLVARLSEGPFTLSHGDYRLDNIFFTDGTDTPTGLKVCDWQLVDRSRGGRDLAYFLTQSLIPELRAVIEKPLIERYVARLRSHEITDYPVHVAWYDYVLAAAFSFAYPVVAGGGLDHADERAAALTGEMLRRSVRAIDELDSLELVCPTRSR